MRTPSRTEKVVTRIVAGIQIGIGSLMTCLLMFPELLTGGGTYALPILMTGILGLCAVFRKSASFGVYMAFCILSCVVAIVYCILALLTPIGGWLFHRTCSSRYHEFQSDPLCELNYAKVFFMGCGGLVSMAGAILSCLVCCGKQTPDPRDIVMGPLSGIQSTNPELTRGQLESYNQGFRQVQHPQYPQYPLDSPPRYNLAMAHKDSSNDIVGSP